MTEVRKSDLGYLGLFATKEYAAGDDILEEQPFISLAPTTDTESDELISAIFGEKKEKPGNKSNPKKQGLLESIDIPSSVSKDFHGTFRGMVQAGLCWIKQQPSIDKDEFFKLYFPASDTESQFEKSILQVSQEAIKYLKSQDLSKLSDVDSWESLEKVMLIWACNSFKGGRVYIKIARANHSCNPNSIIKADEETQRLVAASKITIGDEITISYLGLMLYTERSVRQNILKKTKFFECQCPRCDITSEDYEDKAGRIPCPSCHPREEAQQILVEDVQYDDEQTVKYVTISDGNCSNCKDCKSKGCNSSKRLQKIVDSVNQKIVAFMDSVESSKKDDDDGEAEDEILEEHASLASTMMGDKHWTTNLLMLMHVDRRLSNMSQSMLTTQELPEMDEIAELIDSLQRICRFVEYLDLKLDKGHVLGDVIIGVARMLVSLGDETSQKYGAEWLEKISDYVDKFENEGHQKIVSTLKVAWKKHDSSQSDNGREKKRVKR